MSGRDALASLLFVVAWLLPITYVGLTGHDIRFLPRWVRHQQRVACLFTRSLKTWSTYHVEVMYDRPEPAGGPEEWIELDLDGYFDMRVFGERTRLHRLLAESMDRARRERRLTEIAEFIRARHASLVPPGAPLLGGIRFVRAVHTIESLARETGPYRTPALVDLPPSGRVTLGERRYAYERAPAPADAEAR